jgi:hypothetical protein
MLRKGITENMCVFFQVFENHTVENCPLEFLLK